MKTYSSHAFISAELSLVFGQSCDLLGGLGNGFGAGNQILFGTALSATQLTQSGHKECHLLGRSDDLILFTRPLLHFQMQIMGRHLTQQIITISTNRSSKVADSHVIEIP